MVAANDSSVQPTGVSVMLISPEAARTMTPQEQAELALHAALAHCPACQRIARDELAGRARRARRRRWIDRAVAMAVGAIVAAVAAMASWLLGNWVD